MASERIERRQSAAARLAACDQALDRTGFARTAIRLAAEETDSRETVRILCKIDSSDAMLQAFARVLYAERCVRNGGPIESSDSVELAIVTLQTFGIGHATAERLTTEVIDLIEMLC